MNIELGDIIVKKVLDGPTPLYIFFKRGELSKPILILEDFMIKKLKEESWENK